jgi:hypothetical protein
MTISAKDRITVKPQIIARIRAAKTGSDLHEFLQAAVKLEHATIPPYLTAWFSLGRGTNLAAAEIVLSVVKQEMLHMTIAANILNAIDGTPGINRPDFIPTYPGTLPMSVDDGIKVGLAPLSKALVETMFMRIELPEHPQDYKVLALQTGADEFATIGQFYDAIIAKIRELGDGIFTGDPARQVVDPVWFPADQLFPVTNADTAVCGIKIIKRQGEGAAADPLSPSGVPAHYYRFEEIAKGRRLIHDPAAPEHYSFSGAPVPFDEAIVIPLHENSKLADYQPGTLAYAGVRQANYTYTAMLNALHDTFDGHPNRLRTAIALMYELKLVVDEKVTNQKLNHGKFASPSFEFTPDAATDPLHGRVSSLVASA